ncbi:DUF3800 domain-containing protein [Deinococcus cellulosilyticus]|uniref:DUF3800 domain-containing protein n=1 Tax=Deinococcus cellulosilyticus (strain DSM 18568 / NBRC 106333 / KACC 11606 / 5516J-15) TaxID=1223518 RepID=A0A511N2U6_DEIC1|nr:DUF3800 domain-containing protein [Deinococcus cellulosilyticus]GEM47175.1 hypothetical protein DC3_28100 [Deinococcus cellulosilyticus NBRC 106333 = KACC 11606]
MYLIYIDEFGTSGGRLDNPDEPIFGMTALFVHQNVWSDFERDLILLKRETIENIKIRNPEFNPDDKFEFHGVELIRGSGVFRFLDFPARLKCIEDILKLKQKYNIESANLHLNKNTIHMAFKMAEEMLSNSFHVDKQESHRIAGRFMYSVRERFTPYIIMFSMMLMTINEVLKHYNEKGIVLMDEHTQYKRIANLHAYAESRLEFNTLSNVLSAPAYISSHLHIPIQVSDIISYLLGRAEVSHLNGRNVKPEIIIDWINRYLEADGKGNDIMKNLSMGLFYDTTYKIIREMFPVRDEDVYFEDILYKFGKLLFENFKFKGRKEKGDETP